MRVLQELLTLEQEACDFGFEWPDQFMVLDQIKSECQEISDDIKQGATPEKIQEEIGDLIHAVISLCRFSGFDLEETLKRNNTKFTKRMQLVKELTKKRGLQNLHGQTVDYIMQLWQEAKTAKN